MRYVDTSNNFKGGELMEQKREMLINSCFDLLRGVFSHQQIFNIILGVAAIKWMEQTERYSQSAHMLSSMILNKGHLEDGVKRHEDEYPEFDGIITSLLGRTFETSGEQLKDIYWRMDSEGARTKEDLQKLIKRIVGLGQRENHSGQTPKSITKLVANLQNLTSEDSFADFCAGVSSFALAIFNQSSHKPYYYAEEINTNSHIISRLLMIVNEIENYEIVNKDIFTWDKDDKPKLFDFVVSDPPRNLKYHGKFKKNDPVFRYGLPRQSSMEWAVVQKVIYHMKSTAKGVVIGSKGMLVRSYEDEIRAAIVEDDLIECVITLPENLYENTGIGTEVMILNPQKPAERKGGILFINAQDYRERLNSYQHALTDEGTKKILEAYHHNIIEEGFSKFVPIEEMAKYDYRLNPVEYIEFESLKNQFDRTIPLGDIAEITRGVNVTKKELESLEKDGEYYYLNIRNIDDGDINYEDAIRTRPRSGDWLKRYSIQPGDILLTAKGWETKAALVGDDFRDSFISSNLTRIRVDSSKYNPYILLEFLRSEVGKRMLESIQTGTTITLINNKQLSRMEVPVYSKSMMDEIGGSIKKNQTTYKEKVKDAEQQYEGKRAELMMRLGLDNSKK